MAQVNAVPDPQLVGGGAEQGALHLAGALRAVEAQPAREVGLGQPVGRRRPGGQVAATEDGRDATHRAPDHREAEKGGRLELERAVVVEQRRRVEARAGGELGDDPGGPGAREAPGTAAVDEVEPAVGGGDLAHRGDDPGQPRVDVALGPRLHRTDRGAAHRAAWDPVADPAICPS